MTPRVKYAIFGVIGVIGLILLLSHPLIGIVLIAAAVALPVVAYRWALSPSQRRRVREQRRRRQIGG